MKWKIKMDKSKWQRQAKVSQLREILIKIWKNNQLKNFTRKYPEIGAVFFIITIMLILSQGYCSATFWLIMLYRLLGRGGIKIYTRRAHLPSTHSNACRGLCMYCVFAFVVFCMISLRFSLCNSYACFNTFDYRKYVESNFKWSNGKWWKKIIKVEVKSRISLLTSLPFKHDILAFLICPIWEIKNTFTNLLNASMLCLSFFSLHFNTVICWLFIYAWQSATAAELLRLSSL